MRYERGTELLDNFDEREDVGAREFSDASKPDPVDFDRLLGAISLAAAELTALSGEPAQDPEPEIDEAVESEIEEEPYREPTEEIETEARQKLSQQELNELELQEPRVWEPLVESTEPVAVPQMEWEPEAVMLAQTIVKPTALPMGQSYIFEALGHKGRGQRPDAPVAQPAEARQDAFREPIPTNAPRIAPIIDQDMGPLKNTPRPIDGGGNGGDDKVVGTGGGGGSGSGGSHFHKRTAAPNFAQSFQNGINAVRRNLAIVMVFTLFLNVLVLGIPIYLFQISDRVLTSRSTDTLVMLTGAIVGVVILQTILDAVRRFILMRTAVEVEVQLGAPILSAAARASLHGNGRDYQVLGDLQQLRQFITSGTLLSFLDAPLAPIFVVAVFMIHPQLGYIVVVASFTLFVIAMINQRLTAKAFADSNAFLSRAMLHLDSMSRNSQIINALAMIPEAVRIWGRDTAGSLRSQVKAQDRNIMMASISKGSRLLTQVAMLGWGANLALHGEMTGGMVIAASLIAARALTPIEGAIEGWHSFTQFRAAFGRIRQLLQNSPLNMERLLLPSPKGRLDVERILFVPPPNKKVILNGISFSLMPGESMAVIGNSGAGKTTLGKMLVGSVLPTSGNVRLDLMDLRNWDQRQFGESIGYLPQDVQLFPGTIKANIARMREDVSDQSIFDAATLADVHELISSFAQGYETYVASDGAPLSGGQKQRIALARAFFGNPKMVVLDEPNSNLDSLGEAALARALIHAKKEGITVVTITQRPSLLNCVDKILVLNNGSVSMFGTRTEVMAAMSQKKAGGTIGQRTGQGATPRQASNGNTSPGPSLATPTPQTGF